MLAASFPVTSIALRRHRSCFEREVSSLLGHLIKFGTNLTFAGKLPEGEAMQTDSQVRVALPRNWHTATQGCPVKGVVGGHSFQMVLPELLADAC